MRSSGAPGRVAPSSGALQLHPARGCRRLLTECPGGESPPASRLITTMAAARTIRRLLYRLQNDSGIEFRKLTLIRKWQIARADRPANTSHF